MQHQSDKPLFLDASGEECPVPLELAIRQLKTLSCGQVLCVRSTDPASPIDFEAWCRREPHEYLGAEEIDDAWEIRIRKL